MEQQNQSVWAMLSSEIEKSEEKVRKFNDCTKISTEHRLREYPNLEKVVLPPFVQQMIMKNDYPRLSIITIYDQFFIYSSGGRPCPPIIFL